MTDTDRARRWALTGDNTVYDLRHPDEARIIASELGNVSPRELWELASFGTISHLAVKRFANMRDLQDYRR
jgi:hypothetical protein